MVGNNPNFSKIDLLRCFLKLGKKISRQSLAKELQLGEGTVRTILDSLKSKKLIESGRKGHYLGPKGKGILGKMMVEITMPKQIKMIKLFPKLKKAGLAVKKPAGLGRTYLLRDLAVKNGAEGALILVKQGNKVYAPESAYKMDYGLIENQFSFLKKGIIIIAFSDNLRSAENGALGVASELCSPLKKFINSIG